MQITEASKPETKISWPPNNRLALVSGIVKVDPRYYGGWNGDCPGCDLDAFSTGRNMHQRGIAVRHLLDGELTDKRFESEVLAAFAQLKANDLFIIYYSGHGGQEKDWNGDESDGQDETLCFFNGQYSDDRMGNLLARAPAGLRVLFVGDSCNSGTSSRKLVRRRPLQFLRKGAPELKSAVIHMGGCADGQSSYGGIMGGNFTNRWWESLRPGMTYRQWFDATAAAMPASQVPVFETLGADDFSSMEALT